MDDPSEADGAALRDLLTANGFGPPKKEDQDVVDFAPMAPGSNPGRDVFFQERNVSNETKVCSEIVIDASKPGLSHENGAGSSASK